MPDNEVPPARATRYEVVRHAIAAEVRAESARQGKSGRELAELCGISRDGMAARLRGDISFRADELVLAAEALGVSAEQFIRVPIATPAGA